MDVIKVGVVGARGRMGAEAVRAVDEAADTELVAAINREDPLENLARSGARVAVELTHPDSVLDNIRFCVHNGIHVVVGTSGLGTAELETVRSWLAAAPSVGVLVVPNFAIGAVLSMRFAELAAKHFESAEVVELHHPRKADAPSGTAARTAQVIGQSRQAAGLDAAPDATTSERDGARGAEIDGVRVHSVRMSGLVAHQEVLFGGASETLTIRHDTYDRKSFMPGVLLAVREIEALPGLTIGLDPLLGL